MPPLRDRKEDIPLLIEYFLSNHNHRYHQQKQLSREALRRTLDYSWPGNIRELENAIERAFVLSKGNAIKETDMPPEMSSSLPSFKEAPPPPHLKIPISPNGLDLDACLHDLEKACYEEAIRMKDDNREGATRLLNIKPHTCRKRARETFGL